ncbi:MAG TPA: hypothetical protein PKK26_03360 [Candidatus Wallbacteria bacterium]|nr:hypothetical protein [Candidatus Wallbacteria bacterium]
MLKKFKPMVCPASLLIFQTLAAALFFTPALAINESYNPRTMEKANSIISGAEAEILKGNAKTVNYEELISGLMLRKKAYFAGSDTSDIDAKIYEANKSIIAIDPKNYTAEAEILEHEIDIEKFDGLLEKAAAIVRDNPASFKCKLLYGLLLYYNAEFDAAIMEITRGISLTPAGEDGVIAKYKKVLSSANKYSSLVKKLRPEPSGEPKTAEECFQLAEIFLSREMIAHPQNIAKGISYLNKSIEKNENFVQAYVLLGETLGDVKKDYKEAMNVLRKIDKITTSGPYSKKARNLSQKYYKLNMAAPSGKNRK